MIKTSYIDLARAKSEALVKIYSLLNKIKNCMTSSGEGNWQPKKSVQHTFFLISEKQLCTLFCSRAKQRRRKAQRESSRNFLVTRFMEEMLYVFLFTFFFSAAHFHLGGSQHFPFFSPPLLNVYFFFQRNWFPLGLISRCSSFSVIHVNLNIEIKSKERTSFCCCCFYL